MIIDLVKPSLTLVGVAALGLSVVIVAAGPAMLQTPQCRTFSAAQTETFSAGGGASQTCTFDSASFVYTCVKDIGIQVARRVTSVRQYASVADFVEEVRMIPPISRALSGTTTYSPGGAGASNAKLTFNYDAQRRQTEMITAFADGRVVKTTFTAWDASGRPIAHTTAGQSYKFAYNDSTRTMSIAGPGGTQTQTYDQDGNMINGTDAAIGGKTNITTITISKTTKVCR